MDIESYLTLAGEGQSLYEDRRSEFIGRAVPVSDEGEAQAFLRSIKKEHPAARHHVWAYILRSGEERYSDDGEPQGSAGMPTLQVMRRIGISDAAVVTTRYFGGILLGTGGLLRAYSAAAKEALADAGTVRMIPLALLRICCGYADHPRIERELARFGAATENSEFGAEVLLTVSVHTSEAKALSARVVEMTAGRVVPAECGMKFGRE